MQEDDTLPTWLQTLLIVVAALALARSRDASDSRTEHDDATQDTATDAALLSAWNRYRAMESALAALKEERKATNERLTVLVATVVGILTILGEHVLLVVDLLLAVSGVIAFYGWVLWRRDRPSPALSIVDVPTDKESGELRHVVQEARAEYDEIDAQRDVKERALRYALIPFGAGLVALLIETWAAHPRLW